MTTSDAERSRNASELISERIAELDDWRGQTLDRMRKLIHQADADIIEEWKWMGTPVWSHDGILCTGESYKTVVKLTFAKGAALKDPAHLFNASLEGNTRRAIDIHEGEQVDASAFKALVREAIAFNQAGKAAAVKKSSSRKTAKTAKTAASATRTKPVKKAKPAKTARPVKAAKLVKTAKSATPVRRPKATKS